MPRSDETLARVHDLRVLVSAIQMYADEVLGSPHRLEGPSGVLRDHIELLAEVLRLWSLGETDITQAPARPVDLRAVAFLARVRHPGAFLTDSPAAVYAHVRPQPLLELLDLVIYWAAGDQGRSRIEVQPQPAGLSVSAMETRHLASDREDIELEGAIASMAAASRIEPLLDRAKRVALLQVIDTEDGWDG